MFEKILSTSENIGTAACADKEEFLGLAAGNSFVGGLFTFFRKEDVKAGNIQRGLPGAERGACILWL